MAKAARAEANYSVAWEPQPGPQTALLSCPIFEIFFGGARGGGKTDGMLGEWVSHQDLYAEQASGLMIRRTLRDLEDTIKRSRVIYMPLGAKFSEQDKVWKFPNGSEIKFRYLDNDKDADHYQGHSYTRIYVEEIGQFPSPDPVYKLMATLRSAGGVPCGFRATGNPGGPGHQWVKARYIDPSPIGWKIVWTDFKNPWNGKTIKRDRVFIPSHLKDNQYLGDEYVANLQMSGNESLVRAWLEGDWSVIEGAFFEEWNTARHVVQPFRMPDEWFRFRSADWGSARPFSVGWWAVAGDDYDHNGRVFPRGALIRYREFYGASAPNVGLKLPAEVVADKIKFLEASDPVQQGESMRGVLDPAAFASDGGPSIAERMSKHGVWFKRADNARVAQRGAMGGWDQLRSRLVGEDGRPMIYFFSTCPDAIRTIPALQHDARRPEDVDSEGEDHAADETRYACMSRPYIRKAKTVEPMRGTMDMTMDEAWELASPRKSNSEARI